MVWVLTNNTCDIWGVICSVTTTFSTNHGWNITILLPTVSNIICELSQIILILINKHLDCETYFYQHCCTRIVIFVSHHPLHGTPISIENAKSYLFFLVDCTLTSSIIYCRSMTSVVFTIIVIWSWNVITINTISFLPLFILLNIHNKQ